MRPGGGLDGRRGGELAQQLREGREGEDLASRPLQRLAPPLFPIDHSDQAAFGIVSSLAEGQFIGEYGRIIGEVPR